MEVKNSKSFGDQGFGPSPAIGLTWAVGTTAKWIRVKFVLIVVSGAVSLLVVSPWIIYQSSRIGNFVPVKSNASFELYQSQLIMPKGLITDAKLRLHPSWQLSEENAEYRQKGEKQYLIDKRKQATDAIFNAPLEFINKVFNRAVAATVWLESKAEKKYRSPSRGTCAAPIATGTTRTPGTATWAFAS